MKPYLLEYGNWRAIVYRLPCSKLPLFRLLMSKLLYLWQVEQTDADGNVLRQRLDTQGLIEDEWTLFKAIAQIFQTDPVLPFDIEQLRDQADLLQWLFLCKVEFGEDGESKVLPSELESLNNEEPFQPPRRKQDESNEDGMSISDLPFPSSQDSEADALGNLLNIFGDLPTAKIAYEWLDYTTIKNLAYVARELGRSPDDRMKDHLLACFDRIEEMDPTILDRAWGFTQERPNLNQLQADAATQSKVAAAAPAVELDPFDKQLLDNWDADFKEVTQRRTRKRSSATQEPTNAT